MKLNGLKELLELSISRLEKWVEDHNYKGYEPFDGLSSFLRPFTFGSLFLDRLLVQMIRQSPVNLRSLLGVKPLESTKGRGYMAWGYLTMLRCTGDSRYKEKAQKCLEWLIKNKAPGYEKYSWGNHFDFAHRGGRYSKHEPSIVWTALIGQAFLDGYEILGVIRYLDIAKSVCEWIMDLPREETSSGTCLSYFAIRQSSIHNSNMLGAAMLARTGKIIGNREYLRVAKEAMLYSCSRQLSNGAWYYGEDRKYHWIDNFHTGYNLDSLKCYLEFSGDEEFRKNLVNGFRYYRETFFEDNGRPKYYHNRTYPVDSQCIAQSIETLSKFAEFDESALPLCCKVAQWAIQNMQDEGGHFYYRQYPFIKAKAPMLHWAQATTYKGLAVLYLKINKIREDETINTKA
jgi:rhamnogalacturonyl hydrolase YesR